MSACAQFAPGVGIRDFVVELWRACRSFNAVRYFKRLTDFKVVDAFFVHAVGAGNSFSGLQEVFTGFDFTLIVFVRQRIDSVT